MEESMKELKPKYTQIQKLYRYCLHLGIKAELKEIFDGYKICFPNGNDFVQHQHSYGAYVGYVEPAICCRLDYCPVSLKQAKDLVRYHKDRLNKKVGR
jgi:hypothetical protein